MIRAKICLPDFVRLCRRFHKLFNFIYCAFIVIGTCLSVEAVKNITDAMMIAMCVPNIIVLYIMAPEVKKELKSYCLEHNVGKWIHPSWFKKPQTVAVKVEEK